MNKNRTQVMIVLVITALVSTTTSASAQMFSQQVPGAQSLQQQQFYQLRQNFAFLEQQLSMAPPQQQQFVISNVQQQIMQGLSQLYPQQIPQAIHILQQAMSPQLAQVILSPIVAQLQSGAGGFGGGSGSYAPPGNSGPPQSGAGGFGATPPQSGNNNDGGQIDQGLMDACLKGQMAVSGNTREYCKQILDPNPAKAAGICGYLRQAHVPVPGC
jgi:hypothetical protein